MMKRKGSVLAITVGFSLVFTMLGLASIYMSTLQSETQEKQILSHKAFWLAEAGINKAIIFLHSVPTSAIVNPIIDDERLGIENEIIDRVDITGSDLPNPPWTIDSIGKANNQSRHIQVTASRTSFDFDYALTTGSEDINKPEKVIIGEWQVLPGFTFESIFGIPITEMERQASHIYDQLKDQDENSVIAEGITWITLEAGNDLFAPGHWGGNGFLVVNGDMKLTSSASFNGILWVTGDLEIEGTPNIYGSVFVQGMTTDNSASVAITKSPDVIQYAPIVVTSWKEVAE